MSEGQSARKCGGFMDHDGNTNSEVSFDDESSSYKDALPESEVYQSDEFCVGKYNKDIRRNEDQLVSGRTWRYISPTNTKLEHIVQNPTLTAKSFNVETMQECFHLFIDEEIMSIIITRTNEKASEFYRTKGNKKWKLVDKTELNAFFGMLLVIGRFRESRESKDDLWRRSAIFSRQIYTAFMSRDRFRNILRFIRFDDLCTREKRETHDKLAPLRTVTEIFVRNCRESYEASSTGTVDEQLVKFRGRCPFKVYMPSKPGKYGIKLWTLCDVRTYYCCNVQVYLGKHGDTVEKRLGPRVVQKLTNFWRGSNRVVTADNFFTDITLAEDLLRDQIYFVGTMRKNRKDLPTSLVRTYSRTKYSSEFLFTENLTLVSYVPKRHKCVILLSSLHRERSISDENNKYKPEIIMYYNSTKSGVDILDKLLREYSSRRSTRRWSLSLFLNYLDIAAYNAFVIWQLKNPQWTAGRSIKKRRKLFLEELGYQLGRENIEKRALAYETGSVFLSRDILNAIEATGRILKNCKATPQRKRSRCYACIGNDNKQRTRCTICQKFVCKIHFIMKTNVICTNCKNL